MTEAAQMLPPRILVVDDERQIHASIRLRLGGSYDLTFAFDAREALEKIRADRFDLCLVDIHLPKMDGFAFIEAAQVLDSCVGFVVLSAFDSPENLRRTIPLQVCAFLSKPLPERAGFEGQLPEWIQKVRQRRSEQSLARDARLIAEDRDTARLEREVELIVSETARDALRQTAGLLTTVHAHLLSATTQLAVRARTDPASLHLLRGLEEARKTADAAMTTAEGFFDSSYGSRDDSPALPDEGILHAIDISMRMSRAEAAGKVVDFRPTEGTPAIRTLSGIDFLLTLLPALGAALTLAPPRTTVGVRTEIVPRLDAVSRGQPHRDFYWLNRRRALGGHAALAIIVSTGAPPLAVAGLDAWLNGEYAPLATIPAQRMLRGIQKCQGALGAAVAPYPSPFTLVLVLPT